MDLLSQLLFKTNVTPIWGEQGEWCKTGMNKRICEENVRGRTSQLDQIPQFFVVSVIKSHCGLERFLGSSNLWGVDGKVYFFYFLS